MIDPETGAAQWNVLVVSGVETPGVVTLSGHDLKIGWDIQNPTGSAGGTTTRTKEPVKEFDAEFYLTNEPNANGHSDFDHWDKFQKRLEAAVAPGKKPRALEIFHPDLARVHITSATVGSISGMTLDKKGGGTIRVHFIEFRPPKRIKAVPMGKKTEGDAVLDADLAKKKKLDDEYDALTTGDGLIGSLKKSWMKV